MPQRLLRLTAFFRGKVLVRVPVANLRFAEFAVWNGIKVNINNTNRLCYNENGKSH